MISLPATRKILSEVLRTIRTYVGIKFSEKSSWRLSGDSVGDRSPTGRRSVADQSPLSRRLSLRSVSAQSPTQSPTQSLTQVAENSLQYITDSAVIYCYIPSYYWFRCDMLHMLLVATWFWLRFLLLENPSDGLGSELSPCYFSCGARSGRISNLIFYFRKIPPQHIRTICQCVLRCDLRIFLIYPDQELRDHNIPRIPFK